MNNCCMFNISTNTLVPKENMNQPRSSHGLQKMALNIFAFGGENNGDLKSAEVYDVLQNLWTNLPDMPTGGSIIT